MKKRRPRKEVLEFMVKNAERRGDCLLTTQREYGGYPRVAFEGKSYTASRFTAECFDDDGKFLPKGRSLEGYHVTTSCDNRRCIAKGHLVIVEGRPSSRRGSTISVTVRVPKDLHGVLEKAAMKRGTTIGEEILRRETLFPKLARRLRRHKSDAK